MAGITRSIWVPPRAGGRASSCTASIPDGLPGRTTPTRTIKRVADRLQVDPAGLRALFQGVRDQAQSGNTYGEIPWQPRLVVGRATPTQCTPPPLPVPPCPPTS